MNATLELTHERVDDLPLLLGFLIQLKLPEILDRHLPAHPLHQGLSNGWLITAWIAYILSRADHRKSPVQAWAQELQHTLETLIGQRIRPVEFNDDRLTLLLHFAKNDRCRSHGFSLGFAGFPNIKGCPAVALRAIIRQRTSRSPIFPGVVRLAAL